MIIGVSEPFLEWSVSLAKDVILGVAFWLLWTLRHAFIAGWNIQKFLSRFDEYVKSTDKEIAELKRRLDQAETTQKEIGEEILVIPEKLREDFVPRREIDLRFSESTTDRVRLWEEVKNLWKVVSRREEGKRGHS